MQLYLESRALNQPRLILPSERHLGEGSVGAACPGPSRAVCGLLEVQRQAFRGRMAEEMTWLALGLSSLVALIVSFWF